MKIIITKRSNDYHACLNGNHKIWGSGKSPDEAIGDLIRSHESTFNITVEYPKVLQED